MNALIPLERYFQREHSPQECADEQAYYAIWHEQGIDAMEPVAAAIAGGLLADRLPWVFTAGYQATLHNAFPTLPGSGWAAFAATEDVHDAEAHPGTVLTEIDGRCLLNGYKSWVAHSKLVDQLIITVNDPDGDKYQARGLVVDSKVDGLTLTHRSEPGFLKALSQGFAKFENTPVAESDVFEFEPIRQFGRTEAKFVMLSSVAFMLARTRGSSELGDRLISCAGVLIGLLAEEETSRQVYGAIDREFQRCVDQFEQLIDTSAIPDYAADRRLFRMYTDRIQRRAGYAREEAGQVAGS